MTCSGIDPFTGDHVEVVYGRTIQAVDHPIGATRPDVYVAPGWIDIQVNGYAGVDYNSPVAPHEEIARSIHVLHSTGTTRFFPTVITGSAEDMSGALRNLARAKQSLKYGAAMEAFHIEGPYISPDDGPRGAHPKQWVRRPDIEEYKRFQDAAGGNVRLITISPEWPEAPKYIEHVTGDGVAVSIGHTKATADQIQDAVNAGATMSTHLGNGAHQMILRHPNYIWEQMAEDRLTAGFIVDGIHLGGAFLKCAVRAKTPARSLLVTDASMPACAAPGIYKLGEQEVEHTADDRVVLRGTTRLAGSALRMDRAIGNLMRMAGTSLPESLAMATRNPARIGRIAGRQRGLAPGERADLVLFRFDRAANSVQIVQTIVDGETVYSA